MRAIISLLVTCLLFGCASYTTGERHPPLTNLARESAFDAARRAGLRRIRLRDGRGGWISEAVMYQRGLTAHPEGLDMPSLTAWYSQREALAEVMGEDDETIVRRYGGVSVGLAKTVDYGAITAAVLGIGYGVKEAIESGSHSYTRTSTEDNRNSQNFNFKTGDGSPIRVDIQLNPDREE